MFTRNTLVLLFILVSFLLSSISMARSVLDRHDHASHERNKKVKKVSAEGFVICEEEKNSADEDCELKFVRKSDMEEFEIVDSPKLLDAHRKNHKGLQVKLNGRITASIIFHDDHLRVENFNILNEVDDLSFLSKKKNGRKKTIKIFDRGW